MKLLNIGCGNRFHPDWVNLDIMPQHSSVQRCDIRNGLDFADRSIDAVYHSHVLEHIEVSHAADFLKENHRVLKAGGILRVVVPDLERICRTYLEALENALQEKKGWNDNYRWMMLEMYDQSVRTCSGGNMLQYLSQLPVLNRDFVIERCGKEVQEIMEIFEKRQTKNDNIAPKKKKFPNISSIRRKTRECLIKYFLGEEYTCLEIGRFRCSGEVHQWMYDRFSLQTLLQRCGFKHIEICSAFKSKIPGWENYYLDSESDGSVYKPDSLYIEGVKL